MNLEELQKSGRIFYSVIAGSHAYGTNVETSDEDFRGFYHKPWDEYMGIDTPEDKPISDEKGDIVYYTIKRAFELLQTANPNMIDLVFMPEDCVKIINHDIMDDWIAERKLFITRAAYMSHGQYARAQIRKAQGQNKRVHNPAPKERPIKEDFCRVIDMRQPFNIPAIILQDFFDTGDARDKFPFRPIPVRQTAINLEHMHLSSMEHAANMYRMYDYGTSAKGVFRGNDMLCCESIPKEDELDRFVGLLLYDKNEYDRAVKEWEQYWSWMKTRNPHRWIDQEKGTLNYDQKNLMHCIRLMLSARHILLHGEPIVRSVGEDLVYLRKVRAGEFTYEEIMERAGKIEAELDVLVEKANLPKHADKDKLDKLYRHLMAKAEKVYA